MINVAHYTNDDPAVGPFTVVETDGMKIFLPFMPDIPAGQYKANVSIMTQDRITAEFQFKPGKVE